MDAKSQICTSTLGDTHNARAIVSRLRSGNYKEVVITINSIAIGSKTITTRYANEESERLESKKACRNTI